MWGLLTLWQHNIITSPHVTACCCDEAKTLETVLHFCKLLVKPNVDLEREYIFGKPMKRRCIVRTEIQCIPNFLRTSRIFSWKLGHWNHWANGAKTPQNRPLLLEPRGPPFRIPIPAPLTTPNDSWLVHALLHNYATTSPLFTVGRPNSPPKLPLPLDDNHPI